MHAVLTHRTRFIVATGAVGYTMLGVKSQDLRSCARGRG